jgi:hypothetical protein
LTSVISHVGHLARADEEHLGQEHVAAGELVDELAEEGDVLRVESVAAGAERADQHTILEEQGELVGIDGELRLHRDRLIRVLVDDVALGLVRPGDRQLPHTTLDEVDDAH